MRTLLCRAAALAGWIVSTTALAIEVLPVRHAAPTNATDAALRQIIAAGQNGPLKFEPVPLQPGPDFCKAVGDGTPALYIAALSVYRRCANELDALAGFDLPFLATDWQHARRLLHGAIGSAITDAFSKRGLDVLHFWEGEARVFGSPAPILKASDLRGRKVLAPRTFASATAVEASGGAATPIAAAEVFAALERGIAENVDASLSLFEASGLQQIRKNVLVSNHSLDPYVLVVPSRTVPALTTPQKAFFEDTLRASTRLQIDENEKARARSVSRLRDAGVRVASMTPEMSADFRSTTLMSATAARARGVYASAPRDVADAALRQVAGEVVTPYWKVHFVTNRARKGDAFTNEIGPALLYGTAECRMEYDYESTARAELERDMAAYVSHRRGQERVIVDWQRVSASPFPAGFARKPRSSPAKAPLLYVHGYANSFAGAVERAAWLGWNSRRPAIVFAWASRGSAIPLSNYAKDRQTVAKSWNVLAGLLERLGTEYETETDVDIVVHSMGAYMLLGALQALQARKTADKPPRFRQVVFVAADVASENLDKTWSALSKFFSGKATLYVSNHDRALGISKSDMNPTEGNRAGLAPPVLVLDGIESIFIGPNDFTFIGHSYHTNNSVIGDDIVELVRYGTPAAERRGAGLGRPPAKYYVLRRLRVP